MSACVLSGLLVVCHEDGPPLRHPSRGVVMRSSQTYGTFPSTYHTQQISTYVDSRYGSFDMARYSVESRVGYDVRTGSVNPDYRQKISRGVDASGYYFRSQFTCEPMLLTASTFTRGPGYTITGDNRMVWMGNVPTDWPSSDAGLQDLALKRIKRKLQSSSGSVNVVVPVVELRELRSMIHDLAKLSTTLLLTLAEIRRTKGKSALKYAADAWLTFSFGVKPFVADVHAVVEAIAAYLLRKDHTARLVGSSKSDWFSGFADPPPGGTTGCYGASISSSYNIHHNLSYRYIGAFDFQLEAANAYGVSDHFGLELGALLPAAWELIPFSWVVDYFSTMGDFLDDNFTSSAGTTKYLVLVRRYTAFLEASATHNATGSSVLLTNTSTPGWLKYYEFERTPLGSLPHRALRIKSSDEAAKSAVSKLLNLAAILSPKSASGRKY